MKEKGNQLLIFILVAGFLIGIFYSAMTKIEVDILNEKDILFLGAYKIDYKDYFWYLLKERLTLLCLVIFLGQVKYTKTYGGLLTLMIGICGGGLIASAEIMYGLKGITICVAGMFPQVIFYGLVYKILISFWMMKGRWTWAKSFGVIIFVLLGVVSEAYVSPLLIKIFLC